jgi:hypothetical protein
MPKMIARRILSLVTWITVEPIQFIYCVMFSISAVVRDNLFIGKSFFFGGGAVRTHFGYRR